MPELNYIKNFKFIFFNEKPSEVLQKFKHMNLTVVLMNTVEV